MATDNKPIAEAAHDPRRNSRSVEYITAVEVLPHLAGCLALVRPVSMSEEAAAEWLAVAAAELAGYSKRAVIEALSEARQGCTFHGQIVPFAIEAMKRAQPWLAAVGKPLPRQLPAAAPATLPPPEIRGLIDGAAKALTAR